MSDISIAYDHGVASRLALGPLGELLVIVTTPSAGLPVGTRFEAIGNDLRSTQDQPIAWLGLNGSRAPSVRERSEASSRPRVGQRGPSLQEQQEQVEEAAAECEACRREQERAPVDVISRSVVVRGVEISWTTPVESDPSGLARAHPSP